eukprot:5234850-Prymnesium_polylepis.1
MAPAGSARIVEALGINSGCAKSRRPRAPPIKNRTRAPRPSPISRRACSRSPPSPTHTYGSLFRLDGWGCEVAYPTALDCRKTKSQVLPSPQVRRYRSRSRRVVLRAPHIS